MLTALPLEYQAIRRHLEKVQREDHPSGTRFEIGLLPNTPWQVAIARTGEGNASAAVIAERAHTSFKPQALFFAGVAGSLKADVQIDDVVVATKVYDYQGAKETAEGKLARPRAWEASHWLEQAAAAALGDERWWHRVPPEMRAQRASLRSPKVHFKPIAAGDVLLADAAGPTAQLLKAIYNDAVAIEMEGAGISKAAHIGGGVPALVVRGISDMADGGKSAADAAGSQERAAANAAAAVSAIIADLIPRKTSKTANSTSANAQASIKGPSGDHIDFRGSTFYGPVVGKKE
ncbi:5'-methylthioadenosine/S-adenosylhomocysteine nucleosidase [Nonomuraea sp. CA-218870]|uniref:5'-methylthioadenosine/S-adenosylhomocysteine nucleosidase n=1 Tax=Nonomuraea sp. CA-218870 TaxID=3239998 RepID=UPI003D936523